jgi:hypothetical protein
MISAMRSPVAVCTDPGIVHFDAPPRFSGYNVEGKDFVHS